jgi:hypothetical protein
VTNIKALLIDFGGTLAYVDEQTGETYARGLWEATRKQGSYNGSFEMFEESWAKTLRQSSTGQTKNFRDLWRLIFKELKVHEKVSLMKNSMLSEEPKATNCSDSTKGSPKPC